VPSLALWVDGEVVSVRGDRAASWKILKWKMMIAWVVYAIIEQEISNCIGRTTTSAPTTTDAVTTTTVTTTTTETSEEETLAEQAGEVAGQIIGEVTSNAQNIFSLLEDVLAHVGEAFAEVIPDQAWNFICTAIWFPIHETQCADARCAACAPAVMSAATVCQRTIGNGADARCLQEVH